MGNIFIHHLKNNVITVIAIARSDCYCEPHRDFSYFDNADEISYWLKRLGRISYLIFYLQCPPVGKEGKEMFRTLHYKYFENTKKILYVLHLRFNLKL